MLRRTRFCLTSSSTASRRQHTKIILWGTFAAAPVPRKIPPTEVRLTNLPSDIQSQWNFVAVAAGSRHIALLTSEGHLVLIGSNKHGQIGRDTSDSIPENEPQYFDLDWRDPATEAPNALACGTNYTIAYRRGDTRAVVVGFNSSGQLGLGHKELLDNRDGIAEWRPSAAWWSKGVNQSSSDNGSDNNSNSNKIEHIECGYNHTFMFLNDGRVFACGTNQWGELGFGRNAVNSPMNPEPIPFFSELAPQQKQEAQSNDLRTECPSQFIKACSCGNSFSLFLTHEGRVFGCGAASRGQLPFAAQEPSVVPITRDSRPLLIRIGGISAGGDHSVFVTASKRNNNNKKQSEIFLRGSLPDVGIIDSSGTNRLVGSSTAKAPFLHLKSHASSTLLVDAEGTFWGLGSNMEGQLGEWMLGDKKKQDENDCVEAEEEEAPEPKATQTKPSENAEQKQQDEDSGSRNKKLPTEEELVVPEGFSISVMGNSSLMDAFPFNARDTSQEPAPLLAIDEIKEVGLRRRATETQGSSKSSIAWRDRLGFGNGFGVMLDPEDEYDVSNAELLLMPPPAVPAGARRKLNFKW